MAELNRNRKHDYEYRKRAIAFDNLPAVDVVKSIKELRSVYNNLNHETFAKWYGKRYGVKASAVLAVLVRGDKIDTIA